MLDVTLRHRMVKRLLKTSDANVRGDDSLALSLCQSTHWCTFLLLFRFLSLTVHSRERERKGEGERELMKEWENAITSKCIHQKLPMRLEYDDRHFLWHWCNKASYFLSVTSSHPPWYLLEGVLLFSLYIYRSHLNISIVLSLLQLSRVTFRLICLHMQHTHTHTVKRENEHALYLVISLVCVCHWCRL